jgi:hypothetical protein
MVNRGDSSALGRETAKRNQERIERQRAEQVERYREIALQFRERLLTGRSSPPPRGIYLRQARDRARARGEHV